MTRGTLREVDGSGRHALTQALISAAQRLLTAGSSYPEITVQRLVDEAGVSRWRFYENFADKYDLLQEWFAELNEQFQHDHGAWLNIDGSVTLPALRTAVAELFLPYEQQSQIHGAMYDSAASDPTIRSLLDATESRRIDALRMHIVRGQSGGWIDPALDAVETATWLVLAGGRTYQQSVTAKNGLSQEEFIEAFAQLVWYVLYDSAPARLSHQQ